MVLRCSYLIGNFISSAHMLYAPLVIEGSELERTDNQKRCTHRCFLNTEKYGHTCFELAINAKPQNNTQKAQTKFMTYYVFLLKNITNN